MLLLLLAPAALAGPVVDLCTQAGLDGTAAWQNARTDGLGVPELSRVTHLSSDRTELEYRRQTLRKVDRVAARDTAGTVKPEETGHYRDLRIAQQRGTVLCFPRSTQGVLNPKALVVVRREAQVWNEEVAPSQRGDLPSFESTIHPSYIGVVPTESR